MFCAAKLQRKFGSYKYFLGIRRKTNTMKV